MTLENPKSETENIHHQTSVEELAGAPLREVACSELVSGLRDPQGSSFRQNINRLAGALALSGLVLFPGMAEAGKKIPKTPEYRAVQKASSIEGIQKSNPELYKNIIKSIRERGGVPIYSGQEIVEKSQKLGQEARDKSVGYPNPYFLTPEHILGKGFLKKNPEKADHYMRRIKKALKATVTLLDEKGRVNASGTIVKTKEGAGILTSAHAVQFGEEVEIQFINGSKQKARVIKWDEKKDLALLELKIFRNGTNETYFSQKDTEKGAKAGGFTVLEIDMNPVFRPGEKIGLSGNPLGYPWETHICGYKSWMDARTQGNRRDFQGHLLEPSPEFRSLARYVQKPRPGEKIGEAYNNSRLIPGMSGGPAFRLDEKGDEVRLLGINAWSRHVGEKGEWSLNPVIVSAAEVKRFLAK